MDVTDADGADWPPEQSQGDQGTWMIRGGPRLMASLIAAVRIADSGSRRPGPPGGSGLSYLIDSLRSATYAPGDMRTGTQIREEDLRKLRSKAATAGPRPMGDLACARTDGAPVSPFAAPSYAGDCGLDLALSHDVEILPGGTVNVGTGVAVALPPGTFGWITGRSSTWSRYGLQVMPGIIDEGWRGELLVMVHKPWMGHCHGGSGTVEGCAGCFGNEALRLARGTRLAQLIILPNLLNSVRILEVGSPDELPHGSRGDRGFGSSGD